MILPYVTPNAPIAYPNGFCENPITNEWIVADTYHGRILRFASDTNPTYAVGEYLGALVTGVGYQTTAPYGPVVDDDGTIVVANYYDNTISAFVPSGSGYTEHRISTFLNGTKTDSFSFPVRVALARDPDRRASLQYGYGQLVVLDQYKNRVVKLNMTGGLANASAWTVATAFGQDSSVVGPGSGHFYYPTGLAVDASGNIYVSDPFNASVITIQVFDPSGNPLQTIAQGLSSPLALAIDAGGRLFVTDSGNNRIAVFDKYDPANPARSLAPLSVRIGTPSQPLGGVSLPGGPNPAGPIGELQEPTSVAFDQWGRLLVADTDNFRMQIFDKARLITDAIAVPQTITAADSSVTLRVTISRPSGVLTNVHPSIPAVSFAVGGGTGTAVVDTQPRCVTTPSLAETCPTDGNIAGLLSPGETMNLGDTLVYTFTFDRVLGAVGPVWFSVGATGIDSFGKPVVSPTAQTYAIAVGGDQFNAPQVTASLSDPSGVGASNGWYRSQPIDVNLNASLTNPGANGDPSLRDGQIQEIQYSIGPTAPAEGDYYSCYNFFTWLIDADPGDEPAPSCSIPIFKEGITTVWYRALSTRGLYDRLEPYALDPLEPAVTVDVPWWTSVEVKLDFSAPTLQFGTAIGPTNTSVVEHNGWYNAAPLTVPFTVIDVGSQLATVAASSASPSFSYSIGPTDNVPFANGTLLFSGEVSEPFTITATDRVGNSFGFSTTARIDVTPPTFLAPHAPISSTPLVTLNGTTWSRSPISVTWDASDNLSGFDGNATLTTQCTASLNSGASQSLTCTLTDWAGNLGASAPAGPFGIDTTPPVLSVPEDITVPAIGTTAVVNFSTEVSDNADPAPSVSCVPASGSAFPLGTTTVVCTATDALGNSSSKSFVVTVQDKTPPVLAVPPAPVRVQSSVPTTVTYAVSALDAVDGAVTPVCTPLESGSVFPLGTTTVTCTATDHAGNASTATFQVIVASTPPTITVPGNISVNATGPSGAVVTYSASATDGIDGPVPVACVLPSGSTFSIGTTTVVCTATNSAGLTSTGSFTVTVVDTPPVLTLPQNISLTATSPNGAVATFTASATDIVDGTDPVSCRPPSGSMFPIGTTTVTCSATDKAGNKVTSTFSVIVAHSTPACTGAAANPSGLWPPNHNLVRIGIGGVRNADGSRVSFMVTSIFQDEPTNGLGDGDTPIDGFGVGTSQALVRAERRGASNGRVYHIRFTATAYGQSCSGDVTVGVPRDQGRGRAIDDGPIYDSTKTTNPTVPDDDKKGGRKDNGKDDGRKDDGKNDGRK